jgi:mono/diheme cytochrome c family protein
MISAFMRRPAKVLLIMSASIAVAAIASGCGTMRIKVPRSAGPVYTGAVLFSQRCAGCHTLSYAGTQGSASDVRHREITNGPNFDQRCERPITRVLYAIENGGFSGAIMPQNVVVGQDARDVALFVATYAGRGAQKVVGVPTCESEPIGTIPPPPSTTTTTTTTSATTTTTSTATAGKKSTHSTTKPAGKKKSSNP